MPRGKPLLRGRSTTPSTGTSSFFETDAARPARVYGLKTETPESQNHTHIYAWQEHTHVEGCIYRTVYEREHKSTCAQPPAHHVLLHAPAAPHRYSSIRNIVARRRGRGPCSARRSPSPSGRKPGNLTSLAAPRFILLALFVPVPYSAHSHTCVDPFLNLNTHTHTLDRPHSGHTRTRILGLASCVLGRSGPTPHLGVLSAPVPATHTRAHPTPYPPPHRRGAHSPRTQEATRAKSEVDVSQERGGTVVCSDRARSRVTNNNKQQTPTARGETDRISSWIS